MTFVVAVLSPEYAMAMADTRTILHGPGSADIGLPSGPIIIAEDERIVVDGDPRLDKIKFTQDMTEAFAHAGSHDTTKPLFGFQAEMRGIEADEHIAQQFHAFANFQGVPALPRGVHDTCGALHWYRGNDRFLATRLYAGPGILERTTYRNNRDDLRWLAIGSGAPHADGALRSGPMAEEWSELSKRTDLADAPGVLRFWSKLFAIASSAEEDVNSLVSAWIQPKSSDRWEKYSVHTVDLEQGVKETFYRDGQFVRSWPVNWNHHKVPKTAS